MVIRRALVIPVGMANKGEIAVRSFLKEWRKYRDLTQMQLGEMAGLEAASISQLETGKQWFSDESLANLARALRCSPAELLAHDPTRADSFWPLFQRAEALQGVDRQQLQRIIRAVLDPQEDGQG